MIPSRAGVMALAAAPALALVALVAGVPAGDLGRVGLLAGAGVLVLVVLDWRMSARDLARHPPRLERVLPHALAIGVHRPVGLRITREGGRPLELRLYDGVDATLQCVGLPLRTRIEPGQRVDLRYEIEPRRRGSVQFAPARARIRTRLGLLELERDLGGTQDVAVLPNFAAVSRYAWLAGDRRLSEIGIKTYARRGHGSDFRQLRDYVAGDPPRHIDWKASLRHPRLVVREYEDARDQRVMFLLDCGRRMRADEGDTSADGSHFDQALNAMMLLAWVALQEGDEVGVLTFGHAEPRRIAPRKGAAALAHLMNRLHDLQPGTAHSDFALAARDLMQAGAKRSLVVLLTNLRDEDSDELAAALRLLRTRHLVLVANLRERALAELAGRGLDGVEDAVLVAGAHLFEQARRDAMAALAGQDRLWIDVEPARLAPALVNHYHAIKRARRL